MKIGYDAKRLFFNKSGLGNYSRSLLRAVIEFEPKWEISLFSPKKNSEKLINIALINEARSGNEINSVYPTSFVDRKLSSLWRSFSMSSSINKEKLDIYHGLSNELPLDIKKAKCKSIVTIHDLIYEVHPELYKPIDRFLYRKKYKESAIKADLIIATSLNTKNDLINIYKIPENKIEVVYQNCNPIFFAKRSGKEIEAVRVKYNLPNNYILNVGTIEKRKNAGVILKAIQTLREKIHLVIVGRKTEYALEIIEYARIYNLTEWLIILDNVPDEDMPLIYQGATIFIYPSIFEGFGIPLLEAINSNVPIITTRLSCLPEVTGSDGALYLDNANDSYALADIITLILTESVIRDNLLKNAKERLVIFDSMAMSNNLAKLYTSL